MRSKEEEEEDGEQWRGSCGHSNDGSHDGASPPLEMPIQTR